MHLERTVMERSETLHNQFDEAMSVIEKCMHSRHGTKESANQECYILEASTHLVPLQQLLQTYKLYSVQEMLNTAVDLQT